MGNETAKPTASARRLLRIAAGVFAIGILAGCLLWSGMRYFPNEPRIAVPQETPSQLTAVSFGVPLEAETIEEVPYGQTVVLDSLTLGYRYDLEASTILQEDFEKQSEAEQREWKESEEWAYDLPAFAATVESARLVSEEAFSEWYPAWHQADVSGISYSESDMRFVLVAVRVENRGEQRIQPEYPVLRSPLFHGDNRKLNAGMFVDNYAMDAVYPLSTGNDGDYFEGYDYSDAHVEMIGLDAGALQIEPGEAKTLTYPFIVYRNSFADPGAIDSLTIGDFALAYLDYDPWSIIELELA